MVTESDYGVGVVYPGLYRRPFHPWAVPFSGHLKLLHTFSSHNQKLLIVSTHARTHSHMCVLFVFGLVQSCGGVYPWWASCVTPSLPPWALQERLPLAVVGSNTIIEVNGKRVRGRQYPWGVAEGERPLIDS